MRAWNAFVGATWLEPLSSAAPGARARTPAGPGGLGDGSSPCCLPAAGTARRAAMAAHAEDPVALAEVDPIDGDAVGISPAEARAAAEAGAAARTYKPDAGNAFDPLVRSLTGRCKASAVLSIELVEQRWNGNDLYKAVCPEKTYFVKVNETLDPAVFVAESGGLVCMAKAKCGLKVPQPFDVGALLPSPGSGRPTGAFLVLSWVDHRPHGAFRGDGMAQFGAELAKMHSADFSAAHQDTSHSA